VNGPRIAVITNGNFFSRVILDPLLRDSTYEIAGIVVVTGIAARKSRRESLLRILRTGGLRHFAFKASTYVVFAIASQVLRNRSFFVHQLAKREGIEVCFTQYVNTPRIYELVEAWRPEILVSVSCPQRIDDRLLSRSTKAALNIHSSLLPRYAGIEPYLWVLANGETTTGATVHLMSAEFDTGDILIRKELAIRPGESVLSLFYRLAVLGSRALTEAIDAVSSDTSTPIRQDASQRTYFSWPNAETIRAVYRHGHRLGGVADFRVILSETN
jgi:folate-dependent phosphoribosylglycinamide formyltransferase PurN